jgi:hypothetical protein
MRLLLIFIGSLWILSGCVTTESLAPSVDKAPVKVQADSYDKLWKVAVAAVDLRFPNIEVDKENGVVRGRDGVENLPWLEAVGIFIRPTEDSDTGYFLDIVSERRLWQDDGPNDWPKRILADIKSKLGPS